jgi:hypothetical protein
LQEAFDALKKKLETYEVNEKTGIAKGVRSDTTVSNVFIMFSGHGTSINSNLHATFPTK